MSRSYNIYCDESCHLEHDNSTVMVLGAVWCPTDKVREVAVRLREIKASQGLSPGFELKWTKVGPAKLAYYREVVDYFFDEDDLHFRALVVPDKGKLDHASFNQDHDTFYYKMYFDLLKVLFDPSAQYHIYLDIKDTRSQHKVEELRQVLHNAHYDFQRNMIQKIQHVRSHEVELLQIADLLIGAVCYANRGLQGSAAKLALVNRIRERSRYSLTRNTYLREDKMNIFVWNAQESR